jgi:rhodanese-related sulfurtransferase/DNA-binding transcriptional ArsR family regulator
MSDHAAKVALNQQFARVGKALASPRRLEVLDLLAQGPRTVESLAAETEMSVALASSHLQVLRSVGLVVARRDRQSMHYRLVGDEVYALLAAVRAIARDHLAEVEGAAAAYRGVSDEPEPITREDLWARVRAGEVKVLDLRPRVEYEAGHIPGAVSIPLDELPARLAEMPNEREIVAYCRGSYCVLAPQGVDLLRSHGLRARRLEEGLPEWRMAGFPVEAGIEWRAAPRPSVRGRGR